MTVQSTESLTAIAEVNKTFMRAFEKGDAAGVAALYTDDGQVLPPGSDIITGKEASRMRHSNQGWFQHQFRFLRQQFLQDGDLPFTDVLSENIVSQALIANGVTWMDRIYPPLVTLWVVLGQVLSADQSCRGAVARLIVHRIAKGLKPCSPETGG